MIDDLIEDFTARSGRAVFIRVEHRDRGWHILRRSGHGLTLTRRCDNDSGVIDGAGVMVGPEQQIMSELPEYTCGT